MKCTKHPRYKGASEPRSDCEICSNIYKVIAEELLKEGKKYKSITTPTFSCGLLHLLAEVSTVMLYGKQPQYFWRKKTVSDPIAKKHYVQTITRMQKWYQSKPNFFKDTNTLLFYIFTKPYNRLMYKKLSYTKEKIDTNQKEKPKKVIENIVTPVKNKPNRISAIKNLTNGENT